MYEHALSIERPSPRRAALEKQVMMQEKALACDVRLHAPSESVFLQSTLQSLTMCVCLYHLTFLGSYQPLCEFSWRKKKEKARQKGSGFIDKFLTWVSGLPRSTATPIHHFVQYAKVTLLEISPCQGSIVKRSGVAYSCSYALLHLAIMAGSRDWIKIFVISRNQPASSDDMMLTRRWLRSSSRSSSMTQSGHDASNLDPMSQEIFVTSWYL